MPQERIRTIPFDVRVGWGREGTVQLGVGEYEDRSLLWTIFGSEEDRKRIGEGFKVLFGQAQNWSANPDDLVTEVFNLIETRLGEISSVWATLDREECNRLIRLVRKARDQAFGRDE